MMEIIMLACFLGGATVTATIYQIMITSYWGWIWLLTLNIGWFALFIWGTILVEGNHQYIKPKQETNIKKVPKELRDSLK